MKKFELTNKEKLMLYGLVRHPGLTDKKLSEKLNLKHSTVTSIRHRLRKNKYFRTLKIPMLQNMGCEMLVAIYSSFSPLIPLEERVKITGETIEVFDEIFFQSVSRIRGFLSAFQEIMLQLEGLMILGHKPLGVENYWKMNTQIW